MAPRRSGGRAGGFRRRDPDYRETPPETDRWGGDYFGIGGIEIGGQAKDYLVEGPKLPSWLGGGTLVMTPNEAVSPTDCDRWPGSPYCGEIPFGESPIGLDIGISSTECEDVISIEGTLGWWRMPPLEFGRRRCEPTPPPPPFVPPPPGSTIQDENPFYCGGGLVRRRVYAWIAGIVRSYVNLDPFTNLPLGPETTDTPYRNALGGDPPWTDWDFDEVWGPIYSTGIRVGPASPFGSSRIGVLVKCHGHGAGFPSAEPTWAEVSHTGSLNLMPGWSYDIRIPSCAPGAYPRFNPPANPNPTGDDMCDCKKLEASLARIERILGIPKVLSGSTQGWKLPAKLAGTNTQDTVTYDNYAELTNWIVKSFRDALGDTEYEIPVEDADLVQSGDQAIVVKVPNLAEGQAELLGLLLQMSATLNANFAATSNTLVQAGQATLAASKAALEVQEVADFLGYKTQDKNVEVPLMFTPDRNKPSDFLQPSKGKIVYQEVDDKNDLSTQLAVLAQAAAIIRGVFTQRADISSLIDMEYEIKDAVNRRSDIDQVIREIEDGFAVPDPQNPGISPYGKPFDQRPRIVVRKRGGWTYGEDDQSGGN